MECVMGVGGIFFKATDPAALGAWYRDNLGVPIEKEWGGAVFPWKPNPPALSNYLKAAPMGLAQSELKSR